MFRRKSENRSGEDGVLDPAEPMRRTNQRRSAENLAVIAARRSSRTDSGEHTDADSPSGAANSTHALSENVPDPPTAASRCTSPTASGLEADNVTSVAGAGRGSVATLGTSASSAPPVVSGEKVASRLAQGLSRQLSRGRRKSRADANSGNRRGNHTSGSGASRSPAARSPSLATKLSRSFRGAIMGTTQLNIRQTMSRGLGSRGNVGDDSDGTYSSSEDNKSKRSARSLVRRHRKSSHRKTNTNLDNERYQNELGGAGGSESDHVHSNDDAIGDMFCPDSPLAPTNFKGDPRNLPETVHSYIDARTRMEKMLSATGPVSLPLPGNLAATGTSSPGRSGGFVGWGKRHGSLDITKEAASTTQLTEQQLPFTEAM